MAVQDYLPEWSDIWEEVNQSPRRFFQVARARNLIDDETYYMEMRLLPDTPEETRALTERISAFLAEELAEVPLTEDELRKLASETIWRQVRVYLAPAFREALAQSWDWTRQQLSDILDMIVTSLKSAAEQAYDHTAGVLHDAAETGYDLVQKLIPSAADATPENAPALAAKLYLGAFGAGMTAHGIAVATEFLQPMKRLGLHHTAAMVGDFGQYGRIAGAVMGPLVNGVLGRLMTYNVQTQYRPQIPDERLLQIMAVKPDISMDKFRESMRYHGYSDFWIERIIATMYHEPRYFELKMMSEDEAASEEWLHTKSRRAGFSEDDTKIMVSSYLKTASRTQRIDFYRQGFHLYKEGFISEGDFNAILDELELRPEARTYSKRAAELAYRLDYTKDMVGYYTSSYLNDLIDDDELLVSFLSLGVTPDRAWLMAARARVRKQPKVRAAVRREAAKAATRIQSQYIKLYREQYQEDLISAELYLESLEAIGLDPELARVTVELERAKKGLAPAL